ncbi:hypothetical protein ABT354_06700 [Streptomyces sp. NPDC000594]|uniref:hypothetical protein n=1 Tax=Streptomyces sp. NPDC000594 TaxID=3154261 RepID=UPI003316FE7E
MSIGIRALRSTGATTIALATVCTLTVGAAGRATADTGPTTAHMAVDLPLPPGAIRSYATGVNDSGVIVGYAADAANRYYPVRWNADLSPTPLPLLSRFQLGDARAISEDGTIVGSSGSHQVRWAPDGTITVMRPLPGDAYGYVYTIGRTGTAIGYSALGAATRAVKWGPDGAPVALPALSGDVNTRALWVNSSGTVAGLSYSAAGVARPVKWTPDGTPVALDPASAYRNVWVDGINDAGTVLGQGAPTGGPNNQKHSLTWKADGTVTDLGPRSRAMAINASGTTVGYGSGANNIDYTAMSWSPDGTARAIGAGYAYTRAVDVNDSGVSVGHIGQKVPGDTRRHALRWESDGTMTDLDVAPQDHAYAEHINNAGLIVGARVTYPTPTSSERFAVVWRP